MERKRMNHAEKEEFYDIAAANSLLLKTPMKRRLSQIAGALDKLERAKELLEEVEAEICRTVPDDQLLSFSRQQRGLVTQVIVRPIGNSGRQDGRYLTVDEINALLDGCSDKCELCDMSADTQRACRLYKVVSACLPVKPFCETLNDV